MDIGRRMKELIDHLQDEGMNDVFFYDASLDGETTEYYACGRDFYPDVEGEYFDHYTCCDDFVRLVGEWFKTDDPEIVVNIDGYNYIEVYHKAKLKEAQDREEADS